MGDLQFVKFHDRFKGKAVMWLKHLRNLASTDRQGDYSIPT